MASNSNLPPGVTASMIPGNRPEDLRRERLLEELSDYIPRADGEILMSENQMDQLADYVEKLREDAYRTGMNEAKSNEPETLVLHYRAPNSRMVTYVSWDGQMLDITAPCNVEIDIRGDQKVLWVNVDGVARLRVSRVQDELGIVGINIGRKEP